jgi:RND superfamily putative drug exporter
MLARLAVVCFRRRRLVVAGWLVLLVVFTVGSKTVGGRWMTSMSLPNTDSSRAATALAGGFPARSGDTATAVIAAPGGVGAPGTAARVNSFVGGLGHIGGVAEVDRAIASRDGRVELVPFTFAAKGTRTHPAAKQVEVLAAASRQQGLDVALSGPMFDHISVGGHEAPGIAVAVVILLVAFGSAVAMGLPIVTALFGIGIGIAGVQLWARVLPTPDFTAQIASMIGIGVGIDYALFIVTRYRDALGRRDPEAAVAEALTTAGRAVLFAGSVVVISLLGMILMRLDFVGGLAVGSSTAVAIAVAAALTLLPALLGFAGRNVDRLAIHRHRHYPGPARETFWHRWSRSLQRHPWPAAVAGLVVLAALALPALDMRLGFSDAGNNPTSYTTRRAYDLVARGFGAGTNGPLLIVASLRTPAEAGQLDRLAATVRTQPGVAAVLPAVLNPTHTTALVEVLPTTAPQAAQTVTLVHRLRSQLLPGFAGRQLGLHVGGATAAGIDYSTVIGARLPIFIAAVLLLSFVVLMAVFRSVLVPLKAVVMNLLSIGAAYGAMVAVFQWGWAKNLVGVGRGGPIAPWAPMMLFAIVFGLSMDYEVFLLSRVREEHDRTGDNSAAVVEGLAGTARVITAAAAIMVAVFASFALGDIRDIKLIGFGLATAVFVDATVVRCVLVPATMELLGERNWWLPGWLERSLPRLNVETVPEPQAEPTPGPVPVAA